MEKTERRILKHGETFAVFDRSGAIRPAELEETGLFHKGTRYLSGFELLLADRRPVLLSSTVRRDNVLVVDQANPNLEGADGAALPHDTIHVFSTIFLWKGACHARFRIHSYSLAPLDFPLSIRFAADSAATRISFSPTPDARSDGHGSFRVTLPPRGEAVLSVTVSCDPGSEVPEFDQALASAGAELKARRESAARTETSSEPFNLWLDRSATDLQMMITETPHGLYPYAGIPRLSAAFGRDGLWTAFETLWLDSTLARGVLSFLAATEAWKESPEAVDATPLFVVLTGAYYQRTGDRDFIEQIWPNVLAALAWIDEPGDADGDGFIEGSHGWKSSPDAVFHRDGTVARGPFALCEVQGYVYAARKAAAGLAGLLGDEAQAATLERQAEELRERFERTFWCEDLSTYALALDGDKKPCEVRASNAGHCLFSGIVSSPRAHRVAHTLLNGSSFSGWGIRTLDANEARYNPMAYHDGAVWPHDNAIIALGLARYGMKGSVLKIFKGLFDTSRALDLHRLPELFCGFHRRAGEGPTLYPAACAPQSTAAGAAFLLLAACLGLDIDAPARRIHLRQPRLPESLRHVAIRNLAVGDARLDLVFDRHGDDVGVRPEGQEGEVEVVVVK